MQRPASAVGRVIAAGVLYFAMVFGAGFVLGPIRVLWLVPRVGDRAAELIEAPIMLAVIVVAARWIARRVGGGAATRTATGAIALALLLGAELAFVHWFWRMSIAQYVGNRDLVGFGVYVVLLALFAAMPALLRPSASRRG
jgi:hypothetical protein